MFHESESVFQKWALRCLINFRMVSILMEAMQLFRLFLLFVVCRFENGFVRWLSSIDLPVSSEKSVPLCWNMYFMGVIHCISQQYHSIRRTKYRRAVANKFGAFIRYGCSSLSQCKLTAWKLSFHIH